MLGDFNEFLSQVEKWGGRMRPKKQITDFREVLDVCSLKDLGFNGSMFTWCNHREGEQCISERLDIFLANVLWCADFPNARVFHGSVAYFDHLPI